MNSLIEYALMYAGLGWRMLPTKKDKSPLIKSWRQECTDKKEKLEEWFIKRPFIGIGVACEESNLFVLDLDVKNNKNGIIALEQLEADNEPLPETLVAETMLTIFR